MTNKRNTYALVRIDGLFATVAEFIYEEDDVKEQESLDLKLFIEKIFKGRFEVFGGVLGDSQAEGVFDVFNGMDKRFDKAIKSGSCIGNPALDRVHESELDGSEDENWWRPDCDSIALVYLVNIDVLGAVDEGPLNVTGKAFELLKSYFSDKHNAFDEEDFEMGLTCRRELLSAEVEIREIENTNVTIDGQKFSIFDYDGAEMVDDYNRNALIELCLGDEDFMDVNDSGVMKKDVFWALDRFKYGLVAWPDCGILLTNGYETVGVLSKKRIVLNTYEYCYDPLGMASSTNHGFGKSIYEGLGELEILYVTEEYFQWTEYTDDMLSKECDSAIKALHGKFAEFVKHFPDSIGVEYDNNVPIFKKYNDDLKALGLSKIVIDDHLEHYGDMTGVLILGLYDADNNHLAEISYNVLRQNKQDDENPRDFLCAELELDAEIKAWAKETNLVVMWNEHTLTDDWVPRELSDFSATDGFPVTHPRHYLRNNLLLVEIWFKNTKTFKIESFNEAISDFYDHCVSNTDKFDCRTNLLDELSSDLNTLKDSLTQLFNYGQNGLIKGDRFISGLNMRGTSKTEIILSLSNTCAAKTEIFNGELVMDTEVGNAFLEKLDLDIVEGERVALRFIEYAMERSFW